VWAAVSSATCWSTISPSRCGQGIWPYLTPAGADIWTGGDGSSSLLLYPPDEARCQAGPKPRTLAGSRDPGHPRSARVVRADIVPPARCWRRVAMTTDTATTTTTPPAETFSLYLYVSPEVAIRCSRSHGWTRLALDLSLWTDDEREVLARYVTRVDDRLTVSWIPGRHSGEVPGTRKSVLVVEPPTVERLHELVRETAAAVAAKRRLEAERKAQHDREEEERRSAVLGASVESLVEYRGWTGQPRWAPTSEAQEVRPDAAELAAARNVELDRLRVEALGRLSPEDVVDPARNRLGEWHTVTVEQAGEQITLRCQRQTWPPELLEAAESLVSVRATELEEERAAWISEHGSPRLRRCAAEEIEHHAILRDEWLIHTYPGWQWYQNVDWLYDDPRNPRDEVFALADRAREQLPEAELGYWRNGHEWGYCAAARVRVPGETRPLRIVMVGAVHEDEIDDEEDEDY